MLACQNSASMYAARHCHYQHRDESRCCHRHSTAPSTTSSHASMQPRSCTVARHLHPCPPPSPQQLTFQVPAAPYRSWAPLGSRPCHCRQTRRRCTWLVQRSTSSSSGSCPCSRHGWNWAGGLRRGARQSALQGPALKAGSCTHMHWGAGTGAQAGGTGPPMRTGTYISRWHAPQAGGWLGVMVGRRRRCGAPRTSP